MSQKSIFNEQYLEELFYEGKFPSIQEMLDKTEILERGHKPEIEALKKWRMKLYKRFHRRVSTYRKKRYETTYNKNEEKSIELRAKHFNMKPTQYIKHAGLNFPLNHTPTLSKDDIAFCKFLLLDYYNVLKNLSRNPKAYNTEGYNEYSEIVLTLKDKFDSLTTGARD